MPSATSFDDTIPPRDVTFPPNDVTFDPGGDVTYATSNVRHLMRDVTYTLDVTGRLRFRRLSSYMSDFGNPPGHHRHDIDDDDDARWTRYWRQMLCTSLPVHTHLPMTPTHTGCYAMTTQPLGIAVIIVNETKPKESRGVGADRDTGKRTVLVISFARKLCHNIE